MVRYCHHLASVVRRPSVNFFIFYSIPLKQLGEMEPSLAESIYIRSSTGNQIYFKIAGYVDLDKMNMFSVYN
jgi:hypothetical protein